MDPTCHGASRPNAHRPVRTPRRARGVPPRSAPAGRRGGRAGGGAVRSAPPARRRLVSCQAVSAISSALYQGIESGPFIRTNIAFMYEMYIMRL
jgi:hypothetical protein